MTPSPAPELCLKCGVQVPWTWIPPVFCAGKPLAGTGQWQTQLTHDLCPRCNHEKEAASDAARCAEDLKLRLVALFGGEKPVREFTFDRYHVTPDNRAAFSRAQEFDPDKDSLYLWGPCGVGKTHLAYAAARRPVEQERFVEILKLPQLIRRVRMKDPHEEQEVIDRFSRSEVFLLDDLGIGNETAYARQILQEILDARDFTDRTGLLITSKYSLGGLAEKLNDDTISSRLAGTCQVVEVKGGDYRLKKLNAPVSESAPRAEKRF